MRWTTKPPVGTRLDRAHPLNRGLVAYWPFWEGGGSVVRDIAGQSMVGTLTNGPVWTGGQFGQALSFDGSDDFVNVGNTSSSLYSGDFTLSVRVRLNANGNYPTIIDKRSAVSAGVNFAFNSNTRKLFLRLSTTDLIGTAVIPLSTWTHVSAIRSGSTVKFYINGVQDGSDFTGNGGDFSNTNSMTFGGNLINGLYLTGLIDDVRVYNRALSAAEVAELYADPFCMFESASKARWFVPSVAVLSLSVSDF